MSPAVPTGDPLLRVKEPHLAGRWYPAAPAALDAAVRGLLAAAGPPRPPVAAILVPHAPLAHCGPTAARGFAAAGPGHRRVLVLGPSHLATFPGAAVLCVAAYRTPLGPLPIDEAATAALAGRPPVRANPAVFMREQSIESQLPWLQVLTPGCVLVALLVGSLGAGDAERLADAVRPLLAASTLAVLSSDLVHYGRRFDYLPVPATDAAAVRRIDDGALAHIVAGDADGFRRYVEETGATICGRHAIEVLLRALPAGARGECLAHTTSLDATGDHEQTVGYAAVAFAGGTT